MLGIRISVMFTFSTCKQCEEKTPSECYKCDYDPYCMCSMCDHIIETTISGTNIIRHIRQKKTEKRPFIDSTNIVALLPIPNTYFFVIIWEFLNDGKRSSCFYEFIDTKEDIVITEEDIYTEYRQKKCFYPQFTKINVIIFENKVYIYDTQYIFVYENNKHRYRITGFISI